MVPVKIKILRYLNGLKRPSHETNARLLAQRGETIGSLTIREVDFSDLPQLVALHVKTWTDTYPYVRRPPGYAVREHQLLE